MTKAQAKKIKSWLNVRAKAFETRVLVLNKSEVRDISYTDGIHVASQTMLVLLDAMPELKDSLKIDTKDGYSYKEVSFQYTPYARVFCLVANDEIEKFIEAYKNIEKEA